MLVTVIVDASFYDKPRVAAWAFWIISDRGRFQYSGVFHKEIESSSHAELAAVANALHLGLSHPVCAGARHILVQTDCQLAIDAIDGKYVKKYGDVVEAIHALKVKYGVSIETRHVKGHAGTNTSRSYCQDWCDQTARGLARSIWHKLISQNVNREDTAAMPGHHKKPGKKVYHKKRYRGRFK